MELDITGARIFFTLPIDVPFLGPLRISETMVISWLVMILITGLCIWLTHDLKEENISKRQAVAELIVEKANSFVIGNMGEKFSRPFYRGCLGSCGFHYDHSTEDQNQRIRRLSERLYNSDRSYDTV